MSSSRRDDLSRTSGEVRVGAVLFTDLVGFTDFTDAVGDAGALQVLDEQTEIVRSVLAGRADARLVKELGDGLMLWFGSAHGGLTCAIALLGAIDIARSRGTFPLAVRMGIHHGQAIARGDDLVGQTVNIAARVAALAGPGELLVSESVLAACDGEAAGVPMQPVGPAVVRGVQEPIWLHRVTV